MARPLRIELGGGWYHVTNRGNERKAIYRDERDRGYEERLKQRRHGEDNNQKDVQIVEL